MVLDKSKDGTPLFLLIKHILHQVGLIIVCWTLVISEKVMTHYHSYKLFRTNEWIAVVPSEGINHHPCVSVYDVVAGEVAVLLHCI